METGHKSGGGSVPGEPLHRPHYEDLFPFFCVPFFSLALSPVFVRCDGGVVSRAGGGAGGDGILCHACGYQYPNGHPSAKQRRAHRKHCGKPSSAAAGGGAEEEGAGEHEGSEPLPGTVDSVPPSS